MEVKKYQCTKKKVWFFVLIILVVLVGGFFIYQKTTKPEVKSSEEEKMSSIEVVDNGDGTKIVKNVKEGYEVTVGEDLNIDFSNDKLNLSSDNDIDKILPDISFYLQQTDKTSALNFFNTEIDKLGDKGLETVEFEDFYVGKVVIDYIKVDYKNSEWPSDGEILYVYNVIINKQNFIIVDTSFDKGILRDNIDKIKSFISSIKN